MARFLFPALFLMFVSVSQVFASVKDSVGITKVNEKLHIRYLVEPGETIYGISTRYQVSVSDLLELNPELEKGLKVGQVIEIPYYPERLAKLREREKAVIHKVQSGETLYSLARKYNTTVDQLMKWNNMDLKAGQELVVGYKDDVKETEKSKDPGKTASKEAEVTKSESKAPEETEKEKTKETQTAVAKEEPRVTGPEEEIYPFDPDMKQVLVIPFDPYLYFSDADHEIAAKSKMPPPKIREVFRRRLNTLLRAPGYETIFLLGGQSKDSIGDLNKVYSSVSYGYQETLENPYYQPQDETEGNLQGIPAKNKSWLDKQKEKITAVQNSPKAVYDKHEGQYFAVKIRNPEEFFSYFSKKYSIDYYIFINQFEVKTNYENCLDRAAHDFERTFTTHFSIFDSTGHQIAGNKFKTFYNSNSSYIYTIVADNMTKIANRILAEMPAPSEK